MSRTELIESKTHLVGRALRKFLRKNESYGYLKADLRSVGTEALIRALDAGVTDDAHLVRRILDRISEAAPDESSIIRVPASTRREHKRKGKTLEPVSVRSLTYDPLDERTGADPLQAILECCKNDRERKIIEMRAAGHTQKEVAETVGLTPPRISQIVKAIEARYYSDEGSVQPRERRRQFPKGKDGKCWCGAPAARWSYGDDCRCEEHFAEDSQRYHGRCQAVRCFGPPRQSKSETPALECQTMSDTGCATGNRAGAQWAYKEETSYATAC